MPEPGIKPRQSDSNDRFVLVVETAHVYLSCEHHVVVDFSLHASYSSKCVWTRILATFGNIVYCGGRGSMFIVECREDTADVL